jgi:hypothetical protein
VPLQFIEAKAEKAALRLAFNPRALTCSMTTPSIVQYISMRPTSPRPTPRESVPHPISETILTLYFGIKEWREHPTSHVTFGASLQEAKFRQQSSPRANIADWCGAEIGPVSLARSQLQLFASHRCQLLLHLRLLYRLPLNFNRNITMS